MRQTSLCWIAAWLIAGGCYLRPLKTNSPVESSPGGVSLALVGQDCADYTGTEGVPVHRDLLLKVRLRNSSPRVLTFTPTSVVLTAGAREVIPYLPTEAIALAPGAASTVVLKFAQQGRCNQEFAAAFADALKLGHDPVAISALTFRPY
jgi:hypothetical protein